MCEQCDEFEDLALSDPNFMRKLEAAKQLSQITAEIVEKAERVGTVLSMKEYQKEVGVPMEAFVAVMLMIEDAGMIRVHFDPGISDDPKFEPTNRAVDLYRAGRGSVEPD